MQHNKNYEVVIAEKKIAIGYLCKGTFEMGEGNEKHRVTLSDFYIGKYEVTQREWKEVMGNNPSNFKGDDLPVEQVSWETYKIIYKNLMQRQERITVCRQKRNGNTRRVAVINLADTNTAEVIA